MKNRAFTLLELLVVITIIGILSSIVIVSMSGSTDSATIAKGKAYAQQIHALLGANAVGIWNFDEGTGTTLTDISGYGNNGTLNKGANGTGLNWVASDIEGTAIQFDGVDDYVTTNKVGLTGIGIVRDFTMSVWVKHSTGSGTKNQPIIASSKSSGSSRSSLILLGVDYGGPKWTFAVYTDSYSSIHSDLGDPDVNWHFLAGTYDGSNMFFYLDGVLINSTDKTGDLSADEGTLKLGGSDYAVAGFIWNGLIDDVHIYSEALSSTEIQKHYVQGLEKLLSNQSITQVEYDQRMAEFNQSLVLYEE